MGLLGVIVPTSAFFEAKKLLMVEQSEFALYGIHQELEGNHKIRN